MAETKKKKLSPGCKRFMIIFAILLVIVIVITFFVLRGVFNKTNTDNEYQEFVSLLSKEYDENIFTINSITETEIIDFNNKVTTFFVNNKDSLVVNNKLNVSAFISDDTTLTSQVSFNSKDIAVLLNFATNQDGYTGFYSLFDIVSFDLSTTSYLTSFSVVAKVDISTLSEMYNTFTTSSKLPQYFYMTLIGEINNTKANDYIISTKLKINNLTSDDNDKVVNYLMQILDSTGTITAEKFNKNVVEDLMHNLRLLSENWGKVAKFSGYTLIFKQNLT